MDNTRPVYNGKMRRTKLNTNWSGTERTFRNNLPERRLIKEYDRNNTWSNYYMITLK